MTKLSDEILERAKNYGYSPFFTHRNTLNEVIEWIQTAVPQEERANATMAAMIAINTLAVLIAKVELMDEADAAAEAKEADPIL